MRISRANVDVANEELYLTEIEAEKKRNIPYTQTLDVYFSKQLTKPFDLKISAKMSNEVKQSDADEVKQSDADEVEQVENTTFTEINSNTSLLESLKKTFTIQKFFIVKKEDQHYYVLRCVEDATKKIVFSTFSTPLVCRKKQVDKVERVHYVSPSKDQQFHSLQACIVRFQRGIYHTLDDIPMYKSLSQQLPDLVKNVAKYTKPYTLSSSEYNTNTKEFETTFIFPAPGRSNMDTTLIESVRMKALNILIEAKKSIRDLNVIYKASKLCDLSQ